MKIAMIGWEFPPFMAGGLGIHCLELTTELAKMGVEIDFYMPHMSSIEGPLRVSDHHRHVNIIEVEADPELSPYSESGRRPRYDESFNTAVWEYNQRLREAFDPTGVDLVHAHDWITADAAVHVGHHHGLPLVWTCHSLEFDRSAGFFPQRWIQDVERMIASRADATIAVSGYTKQLLVEHYGADASRVFPVHNGVDFSKFANHLSRDYSRDTKNVLFLSRLSRQKGPMYFMQAARRVIEQDRSVRFIVAGKGEMLPEMVEYAVRAGIIDRVTFTGFVPDKDILTLYEKSDVYVLPSVSEPFGISIIEAMTSGLPTIISKTTGVGEALTHALKAHYWDADEMADMILRVIRSKPLRETLGRNGALESRRFTWSNCSRRTLDVYNGVLAGRSPRSVKPAPPMEISRPAPVEPLVVPGGWNA